MKPNEMWEDYCRENGLDGLPCAEAWAFGSEPDKLAELVVRGIKTATSSLYALYAPPQEPLPKEGDRTILLDSRGRARCILQTTRVYGVPYNKVGAAHAYREGEGDRSLAFWRQVHKEFFTACLQNTGLSFHETMEVVCEEIYPKAARPQTGVCTRRGG